MIPYPQVLSRIPFEGLEALDDFSVRFVYPRPREVPRHWAMLLERSPTVEWVADAYRSDAYASSSEFDPRGPKPGKQFVIRGVPAMDDALFPLYRDAADENGNFHVGRGGRAVRHEEGISFRLVLNPA